MDTTTTQVGPELPPRLRAQYSGYFKSVGKVKKHKTNLNTSPPVMSVPHLRHPLTGPNPKNRTDLPLSKGTSPVIEIRKNHNMASTVVYRDVREVDKERRRSHEVRRELPPDPIYSREVNLSDITSQYTEDMQTFRQVLGIPDPKHSMPVSNLIMGLNEEQEKQEARPKGPSNFLTY